MDTMVQVAGSALRVPARECRHLAETNHEFSLAGLKMAELLLAESRRSVYCHTTHGGLERFARLLAESADRSGGRAKLQLTQEVLAAMLGMRRPSVTRFAQELKRLGAIHYSRGMVTILDPDKLKHAACECLGYMMRQRSELGFYARHASRPELAPEAITAL